MPCALQRAPKESSTLAQELNGFLFHAVSALWGFLVADWSEVAEVKSGESFPAPDNRATISPQRLLRQTLEKMAPNRLMVSTNLYGNVKGTSFDDSSHIEDLTAVAITRIVVHHDEFIDAFQVSVSIILVTGAD